MSFGRKRTTANHENGDENGDDWVAGGTRVKVYLL